MKPTHLLVVACAVLTSCCLASGPGGPIWGSPQLPEEGKKERPADSAFVGLTLERATALAKEHEIPARVVSVDGEANMVTQDHLPERLNFTVVKGVITKVTRG
jgi:hypothetical protein